MEGSIDVQFERMSTRAASLTHTTLDNDLHWINELLVFSL